MSEEIISWIDNVSERLKRNAEGLTKTQTSSMSLSSLFKDTYSAEYYQDDKDKEDG